jgi:hypothetical protein
MNSKKKLGNYSQNSPYNDGSFAKNTDYRRHIIFKEKSDNHKFYMPMDKRKNQIDHNAPEFQITNEKFLKPKVKQQTNQKKENKNKFLNKFVKKSQMLNMNEGIKINLMHSEGMCSPIILNNLIR